MEKEPIEVVEGLLNDMGIPFTRLQDDPTHDALAADWLRKHRHGVDTSEAYDDLRALLATVRETALLEATGATRSDCACHGAVRRLLGR